jgi:hypothetical protein
MRNPNPIKRARRIEMRRKYLGIDARCFYCGESDVVCLEEDHPVGHKRDSKFKRTVCRNCHRKREFERDLAGLTKNGLHNTRESEREALRSYLLLLAQDHEATAASLRRKAASLAEPGRQDCA